MGKTIKKEVRFGLSYLEPEIKYNYECLRINDETPKNDDCIGYKVEYTEEVLFLKRVSETIFFVETQNVIYIVHFADFKEGDVESKKYHLLLSEYYPKEGEDFRGKVILNNKFGEFLLNEIHLAKVEKVDLISSNIFVIKSDGKVFFLKVRE